MTDQQKTTDVPGVGSNDLLGWREWRSDPPPRDTQVMARFRDDSRILDVRTCKHGCCVYLDDLTLILPDYWRPAQPNDQRERPERR